MPKSPQHQPTQQLQTHPFQYHNDTPSKDWEKALLQALSSTDTRALHDTLAHCPADKVMPLGGPLLVGQTAVLSLIHKVRPLRFFPASC